MIVWADSPVTDLDRAMKSCGAVLQHPVVKVPGVEGIARPAPDHPDGGQRPQGSTPVALDLAQVRNQEPGQDGCTISFTSGADPKGMQQRAAAAGGAIVQLGTDMGPMVGSTGFLLDTEGNRIGVHKAHPR